MKKSLESKALQFVDGGRTYTCRVEPLRGSAAADWWWVNVSGDQSRYAPFQADASDTEESVRTRVVAYYVNLLERRAAPSTRWGQRPGQDSEAARQARISKAAATAPTEPTAATA
jgi:hypothetical protein